MARYNSKIEFELTNDLIHSIVLSNNALLLLFVCLFVSLLCIFHMQIMTRIIFGCQIDWLNIRTIIIMKSKNQWMPTRPYNLWLMLIVLWVEQDDDVRYALTFKTSTIRHFSEEMFRVSLLFFFFFLVNTLSTETNKHLNQYTRFIRLVYRQ